jgi:cytochrome c oxidase cbb3-type subunit 3
MSYLTKFLFIASAEFVQPAFAQDDHSLVPAGVQHYIWYGAIVAVLLIFIVTLLILLRTFKILTKIIFDSEKYKDDFTTGPASIKDRNKRTRLMYLVYAGVASVFIYFLIYVFSTRSFQNDELQAKVPNVEAAGKNSLSKNDNPINGSTVKLTADPVVIATGKVTFMQYCAPCHGVQGQGLVGPNLTDDYWLHGGKISDVFKTIQQGVPAKAMPTWEKQLSPKQISDVANYIKSLHGTNPPNAKAPQGIKEL